MTHARGLIISLVLMLTSSFAFSEVVVYVLPSDITATDGHVIIAGTTVFVFERSDAQAAAVAEQSVPVYESTITDLTQQTVNLTAIIDRKNTEETWVAGLSIVGGAILVELLRLLFTSHL